MSNPRPCELCGGARPEHATAVTHPYLPVRRKLRANRSGRYRHDRWEGPPAVTRPEVERIVLEILERRALRGWLS